MILRKQTHMPLYPQEVLTDQKLIDCSASAHGVYFRLMCILHQQETQGLLCLKQKYKQNVSATKTALFANMLCKQMPFDEKTILDSLEELATENIIVIQDENLYEERMLQEGKLRLIRAERRKKRNSIEGGASKGYLYLMSDEEENHQIGFSTNPQNKLYKLRSEFNLSKRFMIKLQVGVDDLNSAKTTAFHFLPELTDEKWISSYEIALKKFALLQEKLQEETSEETTEETTEETSEETTEETSEETSEETTEKRGKTRKKTSEENIGRNAEETAEKHGRNAEENDGKTRKNAEEKESPTSPIEVIKADFTPTFIENVAEETVEENIGKTRKNAEENGGKTAEKNAEKNFLEKKEIYIYNDHIIDNTLFIDSINTDRINTDRIIIKSEKKEKKQNFVEKKQGFVEKKIEKIFVPPTLEEIKNYFTENGYSCELAERAWKGYQVADWKDSLGNKIKNWKQKCHHVWFSPHNRNDPYNRPRQQSKFEKLIEVNKSIVNPFLK